ncbi:WxL domain-containing protein [Rhodococcus sp. PAM 2766]|uniref:WxL domain-containing protein n=1 Tax=Rhodococcus parequi TaxID=3137122 RepID=A0ABW9FEM5_9NOCA
MRKRLTSLGIAGVAVVAMAVGPPSAHAEDTTTTTFEIVAGGLTIAPQGSASLNTAQTGASDVLGLMGEVTVIDSRGNNAGWTVTVSSSEFALAAESGDTTIAATQVQYNPGTVERTGTVTTTPSAVAGLDTAKTVVEGTAARGNNTATWNPTLTVGLPTDALAGVYTGTVSTSVA